MKTEYQVQIEKEINKIKDIREEIKESSLSLDTKIYLDQILIHKLAKLYVWI